MAKGLCTKFGIAPDVMIFYGLSIPHILALWLINDLYSIFCSTFTSSNIWQISVLVSGWHDFKLDNLWSGLYSMFVALIFRFFSNGLIVCLEKIYYTEHLGAKAFNSLLISPSKETDVFVKLNISFSLLIRVFHKTKHIKSGKRLIQFSDLICLFWMAAIKEKEMPVRRGILSHCTKGYKRGRWWEALAAAYLCYSDIIASPWQLIGNLSDLLTHFLSNTRQTDRLHFFTVCTLCLVSTGKQLLYHKCVSVYSPVPDRYNRKCLLFLLTQYPTLRFYTLRKKGAI